MGRIDDFKLMGASKNATVVIALELWAVSGFETCEKNKRKRKKEKKRLLLVRHSSRPYTWFSFLVSVGIDRKDKTNTLTSCLSHEWPARSG